MTGVAHAVMGSAAENRTTYSLTVGTNGSNSSGFNTAVFGSISPGTYRGFTISIARSINTGGGLDFQFGMTSGIGWDAKSVYRIQIVDGTGATRIYNTSSGTVLSDSVKWGDGTNAVYLPAHSGQVRQIVVYWKI